MKGKPILEAKEYQKEQDETAKRKKEEDWCKAIFSGSKGFYCVRSPIRNSYEEPCTSLDLKDCPLRVEGEGIASEM